MPEQTEKQMEALEDEDVQADQERFGINCLTKEESYYKIVMRNFPWVYYVYLWC